MTTHHRRSLIVGALCALPLCGLLPACQPADAPAPELPTTDPASGIRRSPLEREFDAAAVEFAVPVEILEAVAWQESRWMTPTLPTDDGHDAHAYPSLGIMGLRDGGPWTTLELASHLTGMDEGQLVLDRASNIRGAAAVLRHLTELQLGQAIARPLTLDAYHNALVAWGGAGDAVLGARYADDIYSILSTGLAGTTEEGLPLAIPPAARVDLPTTFRVRAQAVEFPGADWQAADPSNYTNQSRSHAQVTHITVHVVQGSYAGCISWFKNPSANVSAHYVVRSSDGAVTQMVLHEDKAWHVGSENGYTIGIEHEGFVDQPQWFTDEMYRGSAALVRHIADTWGIALDRQHIKGHVEYPNQTHTDPGPHWDWNRYMSYITNSGPMEVTGNLVGFVREGDIYNTDQPLASVTVTLDNGQSVVTNDAGQFRFDGLAWGGYQLTASKDGYQTVTVDRDLEVEFGDTWKSIALLPAPPVEDPVDPPIEDPVDPPIEDPVEPPVEDPVEDPAPQDGKDPAQTDDTVDDTTQTPLPPAQVNGGCSAVPAAGGADRIAALLLVASVLGVAIRRR